MYIVFQQQKQYKPSSTVKIVKKDPLEVLKAAGYTEHENSGVIVSIVNLFAWHVRSVVSSTDISQHD